MITYTVEQVSTIWGFEKDIVNFLHEEAPKINKMFGDDFDYKGFRLDVFAEKGIFLVCRRNGEVRGILLASLCGSLFDQNFKILQQELFYVKPDSGRTAYHLFKKFIDIGKLKANHIITMLTSQTNIKPSTLVNLGFKETEVLYTLEVDNEQKRK
ncbi:hypothetical protein KAT92_05455 [Candidatus Babeliales bacterium]|nr:hypothetical protein [Candidatus Babeliales bacterium]